MDGQLKITDMHKAFDGDLKPGEIDNTKRGRHSDALVYFTSGEVEYLFDGYSFTAKPRSVVFLPKNSLYFMKIREHSHFICVDFDFEPSSAVRDGELFPALPSSTEGDFERIFYTWYRAEPWRFSESLGRLYQILSVCIKSLGKKYTKSGALASQAVKYVFERYTDPSLSLLDIASHVGISQTHLRRVFKENLGVSPVHYVVFLRIEKAKNMLKDSNCTVSEISHLCGFSDPYYFSREFKRQVGISPTEYKKL
jgi:AraC-like DNA-binding protein